jgi:hypothetical protein
MTDEGTGIAITVTIQDSNPRQIESLTQLPTTYYVSYLVSWKAGF